MPAGPAPDAWSVGVRIQHLVPLVAIVDGEKEMRQY